MSGGGLGGYWAAHPGSFMAAPSAALGRFWRRLGRFWVPFGRLLRRLGHEVGASWKDLGGVLVGLAPKTKLESKSVKLWI